MMSTLPLNTLTQLYENCDPNFVVPVVVDLDIVREGSVPRSVLNMTIHFGFHCYCLRPAGRTGQLYRQGAIPLVTLHIIKDKTK